MLVLSRQRDETIMIGDNIEITIVDIRGDKVRIGITAPNTIPVHRKEVYEAIQKENREASKVKLEDFGSVKPPHPGGANGAKGRPRATDVSIPMTRSAPAGEAGVNPEPKKPESGDNSNKTSDKPAENA
jgi:carbon storage regulator